MTGGWDSQAHQKWRQQQKQHHQQLKHLSKRRLTTSELNLKEPNLAWNYTDPPVLRYSRCGSNWRHIASTQCPLGNHFLFVDGMVKQVDGARYPPYGSKDTLAAGYPITTHLPSQQLRQHSQYAQQHLQASRHKQSHSAYNMDPRSSYHLDSYESDPGPFTSYSIDPFSAYQLGLQHGFRMSQMNIAPLVKHEEPVEQPVEERPRAPPPSMRERPHSTRSVTSRISSAASRKSSKTCATPSRKISKTFTPPSRKISSTTTNKRVNSFNTKFSRPYKVYNYNKEPGNLQTASCNPLDYGIDHFKEPWYP